MAVRAEKPEYRIAHRGQYGLVRFARLKNGDEPAFEFFKGLTVKQKAAFAILFAMITNDRNLRITNGQKFKKVEGVPDLHEFKSNSHQMRLFCFRRDDAWYLTSGLQGKKEDKLNPGDLKRAVQVLNEAMLELDG